MILYNIPYLQLIKISKREPYVSMDTFSAENKQVVSINPEFIVSISKLYTFKREKIYKNDPKEFVRKYAIIVLNNGVEYMIREETHQILIKEFSNNLKTLT